MIEITTGSRLHFGLLRVPPAMGWPPGQWFGGVGLMIAEPSTRLEFRESSTWEFQGPLFDRVRSLCESFLAPSTTLRVPPQSIAVTRHSPEHAGFGVGTQLGIAVAAGLAVAACLEMSHEELAKRVGRGKRSGIGAHGFNHGGCIWDAGKASIDEIGTLAARVDFPFEWRIVTATPLEQSTWHGEREVEAFQSAQTQSSDDDFKRLNELAQVVIDSVTNCDFTAFTTSVREFNELAGNPFRFQQGGDYSSPAVAALVKRFDRVGLLGAGQSSWGPTVYGFAPDVDLADHAAKNLRVESSHSVIVTQALNSPALVEIKN